MNLLNVGTPPRPLLRLAGTVLSHPMDYAWTTMGFGMIRTYLDPEQRWRLNVWTKALRVPDVSEIHDHPWDFTSWVLCGQITNRRFDDHGPDAAYIHGALPHQHVQIVTGEGGGPVGPVDVRFLKSRAPEVYEPGQGYQQPRQEVHLTRAVDGTVTLNDRTPPTPEHTANIYWARGPWVNAEPRPSTKAEVYGAVEEALFQARLLRAGRLWA